MKRIVAFLLTLLMLMALLPADVQVEAAEQATEKPFYLLNSGVIEGEDFSNILNFPSPYTYPLTEDTVTPLVSAYGVDGIENIAPKMKEDFNARPDGTRYIELGLVQTAFRKRAEKVVYFDAAVEMTRNWILDFLKYYKEIGGKIDGIIVDVEYIDSHGWYLQDYYKGTNNKTQNTNIYADIVNDPRYKTEIRPLLEELGFEFYPNPSGEKSEIWTIYPGDSKTYSSKSYEVWNHVMDVREREAINEAVLEPLLQYYPDGVVSDYQSGTHMAWEKSLNNLGAVRKYNITGAGNVTNYNTYTGRPESGYFDSTPMSTNNPPSYNKAIYVATPFSKTLYDVNLFKSICASSEDCRITACIGNYEYGINDQWELLTPAAGPAYSGTPYYTEILYHIGMLDPVPYLGFIVESKLSRDGFYMYDSLLTTNDILVELSRVAGYSDRKPILTDSRWNDGYILSGMYSGGRNIWRITPDTTLVSVEDFKVKDRAPTFRVNGMTVTFPQGRIIEDGEISRAGSCGYWVETPAGVNPVVTSTATRYEYDPSLWVNFEDYTVGAAFTNALGMPKKCWDVGGSPVIATGSNGNALAVPKNSSVTLLKLPKNITAGDAYAKQQAWEVTVTLPSGFSGDVRLLQCSDNDGGIKFADGKIYYDVKGSYQELSGVSGSGGTYIVKREVDFRSSAFTCSYAVYDASGNLLGEVKDVQMSQFALPVSSMTFVVYRTNDAVLLDDIIMYPTGTSTVLELFEAKNGIELTDLNGARTEDTAYRMSWMNATGEYKVAYVYDSSTGNVIEKVDMGPGMDGVVTGVVKPNGKAITIAVDVQTVTAPTMPNYDEGYFDWVPYGSSVAPGTDPVGDGDSGTETGDTQGTEPPEVLGTIPGWTGATNPSQATDPAGGNSAVTKKRMDPGLIVLIICLSIAILGGGGFVLYWYVIMPKLKTKPTVAADADEDAVMDTEADQWMSETQVIPEVTGVCVEADFSAETQIVNVEEALQTQETPEAEETDAE